MGTKKAQSICRSLYQGGMSMHRILMRKWTWQWLALLGLLAVIFHVTLQGWIWVDEVLLKDEPIPVFYDYPYSDVALAKKGGPPYPPPPHLTQS